ncbi:MAG TPA: DUF222 domain-containing protein [Acidimicrobiales bacterium]|nr:DUF222 domain-containing protein [Acidimicrobiales bacterium]
MDGADGLDAGSWLIQHRSDLDRAEAEWLERLAEFDRDGLWALDGHFCCATWLVWRTNMARSTAFEKLRVAHELDRRPIIAAAFREGGLSYSAVRAITRMDRPAPEVDQALVDVVRSGQGGICDIERLVRSYALYADQDLPPAEDRSPIRDVRIRRGQDGTGQIVISLSDLEIEEFAAALQAFIDLRYRPAPVEESSEGDPGRAPVDESSAVDPAVGRNDHRGGEAPLEEANRAARKADAFMDLIGVALAGADHGHAAGDDRYTVHVVTRDGGRSFTLCNGTAVRPGDASMVTCDCGSVSHLTGESGEPLSLGRRTRQWSTAQRRAITVRDGGQCRFPGCQYAHCDIHHIREWEAGGPTDITNGVCECRRHHRMLHAGYGMDGDPNGELRFYRPDGTYLGSTHPAAARALRRHPGSGRPGRLVPAVW